MVCKLSTAVKREFVAAPLWQNHPRPFSRSSTVWQQSLEHETSLKIHIELKALNCF